MKALEFRPIQGAEGESIAPGAKVLVAGANLKAGIVLVDTKSLKVCFQAIHGFQAIHSIGLFSCVQDSAQKTVKLPHVLSVMSFVYGESPHDRIRQPAETLTAEITGLCMRRGQRHLTAVPLV